MSGGDVTSPGGRIVRLLDRTVGVLAFVGACAGVAILVGITGLILTEIVMRAVWNRSIHIVEEYVSYGLGAMIFLALAQALRAGALVRVDLVVGRLPGMVRRWLEVALALSAAAVVAFLAWYVWISVDRLYQRGTLSVTLARTPMWIPEAVMLAGMGLFVLTAVVYALRVATGGPIVDDAGRGE